MSKSKKAFSFWGGFEFVLAPLASSSGAGAGIAVSETPSQSNWMSLAMWDHTVLPQSNFWALSKY